MEIQSQVPLAPYTSWLVGGPAEFFCRPKSLSELREAQDWAKQKKLPLTVISGGSNVLIGDHGIRGLVVCLKDLTGITTRMDQQGDQEIFRLEVWTGTSKSELLKVFLKHKLSPALFLAGIPGDLGGGLVMNAGVTEPFSPREFTQITEWVEVLRPNGKVERLQHGQLQWNYRHMEGWQPGILIKAGLRWPNQPDLTILDQVRDANKIRLSKQPLDLPSCGSVFVNPPGLKAAQLIDGCGLKGYTVGQAQVSLKHANFIVNLGGATAQDIRSVIEHVQTTVKQQKNVELRTEVIRLGD
jgi:UDP-N-acetylmuramate dehydrogenase